MAAATNSPARLAVALIPRDGNGAHEETKGEVYSVQKRLCVHYVRL